MSVDEDVDMPLRIARVRHWRVAALTAIGGYRRSRGRSLWTLVHNHADATPRDRALSRRVRWVDYRGTFRAEPCGPRGEGCRDHVIPRRLDGPRCPRGKGSSRSTWHRVAYNNRR